MILSVTRTPFFKTLLLAAVLHLSSSVSVAEAEDDFFLKKIIQPDMNRELPTWLQTKPAILGPVLEKILLNERNNPKRSNNTEMDLKVGRWIFVSMSMPKLELKAAVEEAAEKKATLVFRGVKKGGDTGTVTRELYSASKHIKLTTSAVIDPLMFSRFNIQVVPTLVEINTKGETRIARGLPGFDWMTKQDDGDLGLKGQVYSIEEPDMIEEMQRRISEHDWNQEKEHAVNNFWVNQKDNIIIPAAQKSEQRVIDPSIVSTKDIFHPDGRLIFKKGQKINPQVLLPMRYHYIMFDASDKRQVEIAKKLGDDLLKLKTPVIYLFTNMDNKSGWKSYNEITVFMNAPIYRINEAIVNRFRIRVLPSVVEGNGNNILVREIDTRSLN